MKAKLFILPVLLFVCLGSFSPSFFAKAQTCPEEGTSAGFLSFNRPIVPCGLANSCYPPAREPCTLCHLLVLINNIYKFLLALLIIVSLLLITAGGAVYILSSGNAGLKTMARGIIIKTLGGFAVFLLSWLLVYTTLVFISANFNWLGRGGGGWFEFECETGSYFFEGLSQDPLPAEEPIPSDPQQEAAVRDRLHIESDGNITIWESSPGATEVGGLRENTIQGVLDFQSAVDVPIVITGGSESGPHSTGTYSHANGYKVDIRLSPTVNDYITDNFQYIGNRGDGARMYRDANGNIYARESTHWDVTYF